MIIKRWNVVWGNLNPIEGSEQGGKRPLLVVSHDSVNNSLSTVTVLPITSRKPGRKIYWPEVLLPANTAGLRQESIIMAHQVRTISKSRIFDVGASLDDVALRREVGSVLSRYFPLHEGSW